MNNIKDKIAIVTGASSGIGKSIAIELARNGAKVAMVARRGEELELVKKEIEAFAGVAMCIPQNLVEENCVKRIVDKVHVEWGEVNILVNAAGRSGMAAIDAVSLKTWYSVHQLNLHVPFEFSHYLLPDMRKKGEGWIFNISSEAGCQLVQYSGAYGVSKAALNHLTELLDMECRDDNIHVYAICPGWVKTRLAANPEQLGVREEDVLMPEDIANVIVDLLCLNQKIRTGPVLTVTPMKSVTSVVASTKRYFEQEGTK